MTQRDHQEREHRRVSRSGATEKGRWTWDMLDKITLGAMCRLSKYHNRKQSLREERSSTGTQHSNSLFKYQVGTSTPMSEQEPRHMGALQYRLNCQEVDI